VVVVVPPLSARPRRRLRAMGGTPPPDPMYRRTGLRGGGFLADNSLEGRGWLEAPRRPAATAARPWTWMPRVCGASTPTPAPPTVPPIMACPSSIFLDKNRRYIGKSQVKTSRANDGNAALTTPPFAGDDGPPCRAPAVVWRLRLLPRRGHLGDGSCGQPPGDGSKDKNSHTSALPTPRSVASRSRGEAGRGPIMSERPIVNHERAAFTGLTLRAHDCSSVGASAASEASVCWSGGGSSEAIRAGRTPMGAAMPGPVNERRGVTPGAAAAGALCSPLARTRAGSPTSFSCSGEGSRAAPPLSRPWCLVGEAAAAASILIHVFAAARAMIVGGADWGQPPCRTQAGCVLPAACWRCGGRTGRREAAVAAAAWRDLLPGTGVAAAAASN
jgi:hypothetical protein